VRSRQITIKQNAPGTDDKDMNIRVACSLAVFSLWSPFAFAQLDPSSGLILNGNQSAESAQDNGLDSGRYLIKPKPASKIKRKPASLAEATPAGPAVDKKPQEPVTNPTVAPVAASASAPESTALDVNWNRRFNLLEISASPFYVYNESKSDYFYRRYTTASPGIDLSALVWFAPSIAAQASFASTVSDSVSDSTDHSRAIRVSQQWFNLGIRGRHFAHGGPLSSSVIYGLDYSEFQMRVPNDATSRSNLRTTGIKLSLGADVPSSLTYSWQFGFDVTPKAQHKENSNDMDLTSGGTSDDNILGLNLGGRFQITRTDAMFWRVSERIEKIVFSGTAVQTDPVSGVMPSGVSVTNSFTFFEVGYSWGN
jgi:hypothetical protein